MNELIYLKGFGTECAPYVFNYIVIKKSIARCVIKPWSNNLTIRDFGELDQSMTETRHLKDIVIFIQAIKNFILKTIHFLRFNAIDGSIEVLKNSWISKNFN